jgi:hypothetical protein
MNSLIIIIMMEAIAKTKYYLTVEIVTPLKKIAIKIP